MFVIVLHVLRVWQCHLPLECFFDKYANIKSPPTLLACLLLYLFVNICTWGERGPRGVRITWGRLMQFLILLAYVVFLDLFQFINAAILAKISV